VTNKYLEKLARHDKGENNKVSDVAKKAIPASAVGGALGAAIGLQNHKSMVQRLNRSGALGRQVSPILDRAFKRRAVGRSALGYAGVVGGLSALSAAIKSKSSSPEKK